MARRTIPFLTPTGQLFTGSDSQLTNPAFRLGLLHWGELKVLADSRRRQPKKAAVVHPSFCS